MVIDQKGKRKFKTTFLQGKTWFKDYNGMIFLCIMFWDRNNADKMWTWSPTAKQPLKRLYHVPTPHEMVVWLTLDTWDLGRGGG